MVDPMSVDALIVGAGVTGLTTAVVLAEAGIKVAVIAARPPEATTSAVAGASWGPYLAGHDKVPDWSIESRERFVALASRPESGVHLTAGIEAYVNMREIPDWAKAVPGFRLCLRDEVPNGYEGAWRYTIPLIDMSRYLAYLQNVLRGKGTEVKVVEPLDDFDEALSSAAVVVNCTGLGSRRLLDDARVIPCRGQLTVVANPGVTEFFQDNVDDDEITCIFPHGDRAVLGGYVKPGDFGTEFDLGLEERMLARCAKVEPRLAGAPIIDRLVGLRPQRDAIRVEPDANEPRLIHNYGHGGSGVTLSWGCAADVLSLVRRQRH